MGASRVVERQAYCLWARLRIKQWLCRISRNPPRTRTLWEPFVITLGKADCWTKISLKNNRPPNSLDKKSAKCTNNVQDFVFYCWIIPASNPRKGKLPKVNSAHSHGKKRQFCCRRLRGSPNLWEGGHLTTSDRRFPAAAGLLRRNGCSTPASPWASICRRKSFFGRHRQCHDRSPAGPTGDPSVRND